MLSRRRGSASKGSTFSKILFCGIFSGVLCCNEDLVPGHHSFSTGVLWFDVCIRVKRGSFIFVTLQKQTVKLMFTFEGFGLEAFRDGRV